VNLNIEIFNYRVLVTGVSRGSGMGIANALAQPCKAGGRAVLHDIKGATDDLFSR